MFVRIWHPIYVTLQHKIEVIEAAQLASAEMCTGGYTGPRGQKSKLCLLSLLPCERLGCLTYN